MTATATTEALADTLRATGLTYRQVDHWCRQGLIFGQPRHRGHGHRRVFTDDQISTLRYAAELTRFGLAAGIALPLAHELARGIPVEMQHGPCLIAIRPREVAA